MRIKTITLFVILFAICAFTFQQAPRWKSTDAYTVKFTSNKMNGSFRGLVAVIFFDGNNLNGSRISASIAAKSVDTGIGLRDKHARSETALDAEKSPEIRFESSRIVKSGDAFEATGTLHLREVSKEIKLPFTFERSGTTGIFKGKFTISPKDYNVTKSGTPAAVEIELMIPVTL